MAIEQSEIEQLVVEVETAVERLRSLYDQYFMGIERIEPQVAKKDLERKIQVLRRTQIRNTGLRYRFQNVLLRYNTFGSYWTRICRQIEEGTYKRDVRRAKARFDPNAEAKEARAAKRKADAESEKDTQPPPKRDSDFNIDVDFEEDALDAPEMKAALRAYSVPQNVVSASVATRASATMTAPPTPETPKGLSYARKGAGAKAEPEDRSERPTDPAPPPFPSPAPPADGRAKRTSSKRPPPLPKGDKAKSAPPPPKSDAKLPPPPPKSDTKLPPLPGRKSNPPPVPKPAAAAGASKPQPRAPGAVAPPVRARAPEGYNLSDERVRQIYTKYVESRRSLKESIAGVTIDTLAKSLRDSSEKLRAKHVGKAVDFEVQVKDGKTILKPIVK